MVNGARWRGRIAHGRIARGRARTALAAVAVAALGASGLTACMARPGDTPLVEDGDPAAQAPAAPPGGPVDPDNPALELHVGVDDFAEGFNPHLSSDASPVTDMVADLTLPSAFLPVGREGALALNTDLLTAAGPVSPSGEVLTGAAADQVVQDDHFHLRYEIAPEAQWSDGTPISGADFQYLRDGMVATSGVRSSAVYEAIRGITVSNGGRTVDVQISGPLPQWRTLFSHLLPSHLLQPTGEGFEDVLDTAIVASGAAYVAESIDISRRQIRLVRNSRFWGAHPARTERIIIRHDRGSVDGAEQMRTDQLQAAYVRPQETTRLTYGSVPGVQDRVDERPRMLSLQANITSPRMAESPVRRRVLSAVDPGVVAAVAMRRTTGLDIPAPAPGTLDGPVGPAPTQPLVIGVIGDESARAAARTIADQLTSAGIEAEVSTAEPEAVSAALLPHGEVDLVVSWVDVGDAETDVADRFSCPVATRPSREPQSRELPPAAVERQRDERGDAPGATPTTTTTPTPGAVDGAGSGVADPHADDAGYAADDAADGIAGAGIGRGSNLSGLCDPDLEELLAGPAVASSAQAALAVVGDNAVELPIVADRLLTVVGKGLSYKGAGPVHLWPAAPLSGVFITAPEWRRVVQPPPGEGAGRPSTAVPAAEPAPEPDIPTTEETDR